MPGPLSTFGTGGAVGRAGMPGVPDNRAEVSRPGSPGGFRVTRGGSKHRVPSRLIDTGDTQPGDSCAAAPTARAPPPRVDRSGGRAS